MVVAYGSLQPGHRSPIAAFRQMVVDLAERTCHAPNPFGLAIVILVGVHTTCDEGRTTIESYPQALDRLRALS